MHIGEVLNRVYDQEVGWRPASGSIKPVHVANGLVRAVTGAHYDTDRLHRFVVWWKAGKRPDNARSFEVLQSEDPVYGSLANTANEFDRARRFVGGLLNADSGLFPSSRSSDPTITCAQMASRSGNDRGLGKFGAALLRGAPEAELLAEAISRAALVERPEDPITASVWPLLDRSGGRESSATQSMAALKRKHNSSYVLAMQRAAADLASHEIAQGNRLRTLERSVQFMCVAPLVHAQFLGGGSADARVPMLLAADGLSGDEVVAASERSLFLVYEDFEEWLAERLAERIRDDKPLDGSGSVVECSADGREVRRILRGIGTATSGHQEPNDMILEARMAAFQEVRQRLGKEDEARLMAHTLVSAYLREYESGGPRDFLRSLNCRAGMIFPYFQGRGARRVRPSVSMLDMIVRACVANEDAIPLTEFLGRLWDRFGIIVGGNRTHDHDDVDLLHRHGIAVDPSALDANTEALVSQLDAMGLARRYADNVAFIGNAYAA